jgi:hypothetical protein
MTFLARTLRNLFLAVLAVAAILPFAQVQAQGATWRYSESNDGDRGLVSATTAAVSGKTVPAQLSFSSGQDHPKDNAFGALAIVLTIADPSALKRFHFDDFEGPDSAIGGRKLMHFRILANGKVTAIDVAPSGSYVDQQGKETFAFEASELAAKRRSPERQIIEALGAADRLEISVSDSRDRQLAIVVKLPVAAEREHFKALLTTGR